MRHLVVLHHICLNKDDKIYSTSPSTISTKKLCRPAYCYEANVVQGVPKNIYTYMSQLEHRQCRFPHALADSQSVQQLHLHHLKLRVNCRSINS